MIVCWLLSMMSSPIFGQVSHCIIALELWNCITQIFFSKLTSSILSERDIVTYILGGIGQEYDLVVATVTGKKEDVSVQETQLQLASFESRLEQFSSTANVDLSNAYANIMRRIQKGDLPPNFKIHQVQQPFQGRFRGRGRGRGGRFYNNRASCQLCGKLGRNAIVCYHRYDQTGQTHSNRFDQSANAYQPHNSSYNAMIASSSTIADPSWYVDSGVKNHITPDFNNLSISNEYRGDAHIFNVIHQDSSIVHKLLLPAH
ncbi:hypothetical protein ACOSP7_004427 [Xanthoceras sorbifolium]